MAKQLIDLEPNDSVPDISLSNIYAANRKWDCIEIVRDDEGEGIAQKSTVESSKSYDSRYKRNMMYSMLRGIGASMRSSCRELDTF